MIHKPLFTALDLPEYSWLKIINPSAILRNVRHALFDFDGTISLIRRGWEKIMIPMMVEMICGEHDRSPEIISAVEDYVDQSTGILTIKQMQWLVQTVEHYGYVRQPLTAHAYKKIYNERLLLPVKERMSQMDGSQSACDQLMVSGARIFLQSLQEQGIKLYLASGTDHEYVIEEAQILGVSDYFTPHIYGALDDTPAFTKERIIQDIIHTHDLHGEQLMVVGDGPVEIRHAKTHGALALGVAANENKKRGFNLKKVQRLKQAGVDLIIADFKQRKELLDFLCFTDAQP